MTPTRKDLEAAMKDLLRQKAEGKEGFLELLLDPTDGTLHTAHHASSSSTIVSEMDGELVAHPLIWYIDSDKTANELLLECFNYDYNGLEEDPADPDHGKSEEDMLIQCLDDCEIHEEFLDDIVKRVADAVKSLQMFRL